MATIKAKEKKKMRILNDSEGKHPFAGEVFLNPGHEVEARIYEAGQATVMLGPFGVTLESFEYERAED